MIPGLSMMQAGVCCGGGGGGVVLSPIGSCQRTGSRAVARRGPGPPAVTSLTPAETIHLVRGGPPWAGRGTCHSPQPACAGRQECARSAVDRLNQRVVERVRTKKKKKSRGGGTCLRLFPALTGVICGAVHMNHSPADRSRKQK